MLMMNEVLEGMKYTNQEIGEMFKKEFEIGSNDLVTMSDIDVFSFCEHHIALMYDMKVSVAYLPKDGKVLGIYNSASEIQRISLSEFGVMLWQTQISLCCKTHKKHKGFYFEYA